MNKSKHPKDKAFTLTELIVVVGVVSILILLPITAMAVSKSASVRLQCVSNLKQVGLAFRLWANNNADRFPMRVAARDGGPNFQGNLNSSSTYVSANGIPPTALWTMFSAMSNELSTPKILYCPTEYDAAVSQATVWQDSDVSTVDFNNNPGASTPNGNSRLSYFVGLDTEQAKPRMFLAGDHNMGPGLAGNTNSAPTTPQIWGNFSASVVISSQAGNGTSSNLALVTAAWADNGHQRKGNIVLSDGSVERVDTARLREALSKTGDTTSPHNRLVFP